MPTTQETSAVWKFPLSAQANEIRVKMPEGAVVLHFALQHDLPTIWADVRPKAASVTRIFRIFGTGEPIPSGSEYVGTFQQGPFVWHVFEVQP